MNLTRVDSILRVARPSFSKILILDETTGKSPLHSVLYCAHTILSLSGLAHEFYDRNDLMYSSQVLKPHFLLFISTLHFRPFRNNHIVRPDLRSRRRGD